MKRILYISYDGMTDQLGQSQVIPYLIGLSKAGYAITIVSFEKEGNYAKKMEYIKELLTTNKIIWKPLTYTKKPPVVSTMYDVYRMKMLAMNLHRETPFDAVHCRSYISALVGLFMKRKHGIKFIFDMRGFWADERVDGGLWNLNNPLYRLLFYYFKRKEKAFFTEADYTISLTEAGRREVIQLINPAKPMKIQVIPCCVDTDLFSQDQIEASKREAMAKELGITNDDFIISYLGAIGTWYMMEEMMQFFTRLLLQRPNAKFLFITNEAPEAIYEIAARYAISLSSILIREATRAEVPMVLSLSRLSIFFIRPTYSKIASSPTKMGEIMSMGIPIICNTGIGDVAENIGACGAVIDTFSEAEYDKIIHSLPSLLSIPKDTIRKRAIELFSLRKGIQLYREVYSSMFL